MRTEAGGEKVTGCEKRVTSHNAGGLPKLEKDGKKVLLKPLGETSPADTFILTP